jgi:hypothetical protein
MHMIQNKVMFKWNDYQCSPPFGVISGPPQAGPQSGYGGNWNWNMPQNGPPAPGGPPGPSQGPPGPQGE